MTRPRWFAAVALALVLTGCSSGGGEGTPTTQATSPASASPSGAPQTMGRQPGGGGTSGLIAYVSGQVMQVQADDMQTAVTWTDATEITAQVAGSLADVVPGVCVIATGGSSGSAATQVAVTQPVDGECGPAFGGMGGAVPGGDDWPAGMPGGFPTDMPEGFPTDMPEGFPTEMPGGGRPAGMPTDMPTDMPGGMPTEWPGGMPTEMPGMVGGFAGLTSGLVTAVSGSSITVGTTQADGSTSTSTVTVDDATTYTTTVTAAADAIVVGQCVLARGEADSAGMVTATTLVVSAPTDGVCTGSGRGAMGGRGMADAAGDDD